MTVQALSCTFGFEPFFPVSCLMTSSDDERLSGGMAGLSVADAGGGGDAAVSTVSAPRVPKLLAVRS
jgi:hypothetical protein